ncbi:hypothetical protein D3C87_1823760 [compost metagenome]
MMKDFITNSQRHPGRFYCPADLASERGNLISVRNRQKCQPFQQAAYSSLSRNLPKGFCNDAKAIGHMNTTNPGELSQVRTFPSGHRCRRLVNLLKTNSVSPHFTIV